MDITINREKVKPEPKPEEVREAASAAERISEHEQGKIQAEEAEIKMEEEKTQVPEEKSEAEVEASPAEVEAEAEESLKEEPKKAKGKKKEPEEKKKGSAAKEWAKTIIIPIIIAILILQVIRPTLVRQQSMMPTVQPNNYLIVYKLAYQFGHDPQRGDIIVFKSDLMTDNEQAKYLIKRVIATGGETIQISDGEVYVNGEQLEEPYINGDYTPGDVSAVEVPEGCLFVMGDNRPNSTDSRSESVGFVKGETVMGKVVLRLFPFNEIGSVY